MGIVKGIMLAGDFTLNSANSRTKEVTFETDNQDWDGTVLKAETELVTSLRSQALQSLAEAQDEDAQRGSCYPHNDTDPDSDPFVNPDARFKYGQG